MKTLIELKEKETAKIISLNGGTEFKNKLESIGIRPGIIVEKKASQFKRGPVCIKIGSTEVAIGFGMAQKILIELKES